MFNIIPHWGGGGGGGFYHLQIVFLIDSIKEEGQPQNLVILAKIH